MEEEDLDPRIQIELEKLNTATEEINKLESTLEDANNMFRTTLTESTGKLKTLAKKLGSSIDKARPYYEAKDVARKSQLDCQRAAVQFQRANALHQAAKETITMAEERFVNSPHGKWQFDSAWQEMLNHATMKVMEAEAQKAASEREHQKRAMMFNSAETTVQKLSSKLRSSIQKSQIYFEQKTAVQSQLEAQKERVQQLQRSIAASKLAYANSLKILEQISEQIHEARKCQLPREPGVGAELKTNQEIYEECKPPFIEGEWELQTTSLFSNEMKPQCVLGVCLEDQTTQEEKYWESLREKLENLRTASHNNDGLYVEQRERSITGCSELELPDLDERVVSGESSVYSESEGIPSPMEHKESFSIESSINLTCSLLPQDSQEYVPVCKSFIENNNQTFSINLPRQEIRSKINEYTSSENVDTFLEKFNSK